MGKEEHNAFGTNPHLVVANPEHTDRHLYDCVYACSDMENRITRTSS